MKMQSVYQYKNINMLDHGKMVWHNTQQLILGNFDKFKLPAWFIRNHHFLVNNLYNWDIISTYNQLHDAGKAFCLQVDSAGRQHFPDHAEVSKKVFLEYFPDKKIEAELIGLDMLLHTENWETIQELDLPIKALCTLLITAFAEIHANAEMFAASDENPTDSVNFKIKYKKLDRVGKHIVDKVKKHNDRYGYIFVRKDLKNNSHIAVQAAHALFERERTEHPSIIILGVADEQELKSAMAYLLKNNVQFSIFREPMEPYENSITAVATESLDLERKKLLNHYSLLKI